VRKKRRRTLRESLPLEWRKKKGRLPNGIEGEKKKSAKERKSHKDGEKKGIKKGKDESHRGDPSR